MLSASLEINITAYACLPTVERLVDALRAVLPSTSIRVWDNSPQPLALRGVDDIRWHRFNPSLSRVWNWILAQAQTERVIIANDDIILASGWLARLEDEVAAHPDCLWHGPSRFFLVRPAIVDVVGWFDENLTGFTYEDLDYIRRMNALKVPHLYGKLSNLERSAASCKERVQRTCHPVDNEEYMRRKYGPDSNTEDFTCAPLFETPNFYPLRPR